VNVTDEQGRRRLDNPEDFVRIEIATALSREVRVIPVLLDGASMPRTTDLPDDLKPLVRRNARYRSAIQLSTKTVAVWWPRSSRFFERTRNGKRRSNAIGLMRINAKVRRYPNCSSAMREKISPPLR
jgi:hypothetical protein